MPKVNTQNTSTSSRGPISISKLIKRVFVFALITAALITAFNYSRATVVSVQSNAAFIELAKETLDTDSQDPVVLKRKLQEVMSSAFIGYYDSSGSVRALLDEIDHDSFHVNRVQFDAASIRIMDFLEKSSDLKNGTLAFKALNATAKIPLSVSPQGAATFHGKLYQTFGDDFADFINRSGNLIAANTHADYLYQELLMELDI